MRKKILFVVGMFAGGGAEKVLVNMVNTMDPNKYDISVYSIFNTGIPTYLNENVKQFSTFNVKPGSNDTVKGNSINAKIKNLIFTLFWKYFSNKLFYKLAIKDEYDIEVAYVEGMPHKVIAASPNKKSKKLAWIHIDLDVHKRSTELYKNIEDEKKCYKKFEKLVFVSDYSKKSFENKYRIKENLVTKYNVNLTNEIKEKAQEKVIDIERKKSPLFVTVGRLHDQKGYDRLLEVCNNLIKNGYCFELWIIGEGALKNEFQQYIDANNLNNCIKLLGFKHNPYKYVKQADWFVASSRYEGYSTVVSEALILEVPVVVTDCSGMKEITEDGEYGIVTPNSTEGIKEALKYVLDNDVHDNYKEKAVIRSRYFDQDRALKDIEELF